VSLGKANVVEHWTSSKAEALQFERDVDEVVLHLRGIGVEPAGAGGEQPLGPAPACARPGRAGPMADDCPSNATTAADDVSSLLVEGAHHGRRILDE